MTSAPYLLRSVLLFARVLRGLGLSVAAEDVIAFLRCMQVLGVRSRGDVRDAARSLFTTSVVQRERFDRAVDRFWSCQHLLGLEGSAPLETGLEWIETTEKAMIADNAEDSESSDQSLTWSATERLRRKDFGAMDDVELRAVYHLMNKIRLELPLRCLLYTSPSPRDLSTSRMPSSA